ncbi:ISC1316 family transposase [Saccharolobus shibatae]|uniref:ISC1316 family transposase n=1 Tax=Saccharolobus shibatae TaxID=2286 RepID=A0A8F5BYU4_9CREN|nr:ISC1316 family transposase [Saccharolobus shibatae]
MYKSFLKLARCSYALANLTLALNQFLERNFFLDLRKQDKEYKQLYSQVVQEIANRFYEARQRFFQELARFPKEKKIHKWYSLVYPQSGWKILSVREIRTGSRKNKKKLLVLSLSHLGIFKVIVHRDFPLDKVKRVVVKLTKSERVHIICSGRLCVPASSKD